MKKDYKYNDVRFVNSVREMLKLAEEEVGEKNAFEYKIESGDMVVITINPDFSKPAVIMPYFGWKFWCWWLSAPFLIKNRK